MQVLRNSGYCSAMVHDSYGVRHHQCPRRAALTVDGKAYCRQHAPDQTAARRAASDAKVRQQIAAIDWHSKLQQLEREVIRTAKDWRRLQENEMALLQAVEALVWHENQKPAQEEPRS